MNCRFIGNRSHGGGGGVDAGAWYAEFTDCIFTGNSANLGGAVLDPNGNFTHCTFTGNSARGGGGTVFGGGTFRNSVITYNSANSGGAIHGSEGTFVNCTISHNSARTVGGAGFFFGESPIFMNCVFIGNSIPEGERGSALYCINDSRLAIKNTIIAFSDGAAALFFRESPGCRFEHCDIFGNSGGNFDYWSNPEEDVPPGLGVIDTANANGDSCDTYMNIYLDPLLRDIANEDYHLMWTQCGDSADSPCIDAGDPSIHDHTLDCAWGLGSLISDIGLYGGDTVISGISYPSHPLLPDKPTLFQNFPNPFNPITQIQFDLPRSMQVELRIYNILGQEVVTLANDIFPAGTHRVSWNAVSLPSGIYICQLKAGDFVDAKKMVLLR